MLRHSINAATKKAHPLITRQLRTTGAASTSTIINSSVSLRQAPSSIASNHRYNLTTHFSTAKKDDDDTKEKPSLKDTINRIKSEQNDGTTQSDNKSTSSEETQDILLKIRDYFDGFKEGVAKTWDDLLESEKPKNINKKIGTSSKRGTKKEEWKGPTGLVAIDESENLGAWEKMQRRLAEAPIIAEILGTSQQLYESTGAKKAVDQTSSKLSDIKHDAQEAWETSQNPWVYRVSSVYDTITAESEFAAAVRKLRVLDPSFTLEGFKRDVEEDFLPNFMRNFLRGDVKSIEPFLGEAVFHRINAEVKTREKEGIILDEHVLSIFNAEVLECHVDKVNKHEPILMYHFMCQQINCARNREGEIVEGSEDDIKAHSYFVCFQREYDEEEGSLNWKMIDFRPNGAIAWL